MGGDRMGRVPPNGLGKGKGDNGVVKKTHSGKDWTAISLGLPTPSSHRTFALRFGVVTEYLFSSRVSYVLAQKRRVTGGH